MQTVSSLSNSSLAFSQQQQTLKSERYLDAGNRENTKESALANKSSLNGLDGSVLKPISSFEARSSGVQLYSNVGAAESQNPYAQTILNAMQSQLARDVDAGASQDDLQSRLEAGLEGFLDGFNDAYTQLSESGMLNAGVETEIGDTKTRVLAGVMALAEKYGLEMDISEYDDVQSTERGERTELSRVLSDIVGGASADQRGFTSYGVGQYRDFSFSLQTAEGDSVTISAQALRVGVSQFEYGGGSSGLSLAGMQENQFSLSVEGELDEDEVKVINDLLSQVNSVTDTFFNGDAQDAFEMALAVGFDSDEISQFALNIKRTDIARVDATYGAVANTCVGSALRGLPTANKLAALSDLVQQIKDANKQAVALGQNGQFVTNLTEQMSQLRYQDAEKSASLTSFVQNFSQV